MRHVRLVEFVLFFARLFLTRCWWGKRCRPAGPESHCCSQLPHRRHSVPLGCCSWDLPRPQSTLALQYGDIRTGSWSNPVHTSPERGADMEQKVLMNALVQNCKVLHQAWRVSDPGRSQLYPPQQHWRRTFPQTRPPGQRKNLYYQTNGINVQELAWLEWLTMSGRTQSLRRNGA